MSGGDLEDPNQLDTRGWGFVFEQTCSDAAKGQAASCLCTLCGLLVFGAAGITLTILGNLTKNNALSTSGIVLLFMAAVLIFFGTFMWSKFKSLPQQNDLSRPTVTRNQTTSDSLNTVMENINPASTQEEECSPPYSPSTNYVDDIPPPSYEQAIKDV